MVRFPLRAPLKLTTPLQGDAHTHGASYVCNSQRVSTSRSVLVVSRLKRFSLNRRRVGDKEKLCRGKRDYRKEINKLVQMLSNSSNRSLFHTLNLQTCVAHPSENGWKELSTNTLSLA